MAKKLLFSLLTCTIVLGFSFFSPLEGSNIPKKIISNSDFCDAPPPDSFRVTSINSEEVNFAWIPAWTGASHTVTISLMNENGGWNDIATDNNVSGDTYSFSAPSSGSYKATIATNCTNGERSIRDIFLPFKIIELFTGGRIPVNPKQVDGCKGEMNATWMGFRVTKIGTSISNLFEITKTGQVKRVFSPNQITTVDVNGDIPLSSAIPLFAQDPLRIDDLMNGNPNNRIIIGYLSYFFQDNGIGICVSDLPDPWKDGYLFTALVANEVVTTGSNFGIDINDVTTKNQTYIDYIKVLNPIKDEISIFIPKASILEDQYTIQLFNTEGRLLLNSTSILQDDKLSFSAELIPPGIYFLQIKSSNDTKIFKVIKS